MFKSTKKGEDTTGENNIIFKDGVYFRMKTITSGRAVNMLI